MGRSEFFCYCSFGNMNFQDIGCFFFFFLLVFLEWSFMGLGFFSWLCWVYFFRKRKLENCVSRLFITCNLQHGLSMWLLDHFSYWWCGPNHLAEAESEIHSLSFFFVEPIPYDLKSSHFLKSTCKDSGSRSYILKKNYLREFLRNLLQKRFAFSILFSYKILI